MNFNSKNAQGFFKLVSNLCSDLRMSVTRDHSIDGRMKCGDGYRVTFKRNGHSFRTQFNNSRYNSEKGILPDIQDILYCLLSDRDAYEFASDYSDFCSEFGYDEYNDYGSRRNKDAVRAFNGCRKIAERINAMFSNEEIDKINEYCNMTPSQISEALAC